jgi:hypothetical protein
MTYRAASPEKRCQFNWDFGQILTFRKSGLAGLGPDRMPVLTGFKD